MRPPPLLLRLFMRQRKKAFATPSDVLGANHSDRRIKEGIRLYRIWDLWPTIAGETLAPHAIPARWQGRDLIVKVEHSAWVQELSFMKDTLKEKIAKALPGIDIRQIRFEVGKLPEPPKGALKARPRISRRLSNDEIEFIEQAAKEIPDGEVRESARSAMQKGFGLKKAR